MQGNQLKKNTAGVVIHNDIKKYPFLNIPMIINEEDGMVYEVLNAGFYTNDGSKHAYRLPLELEHWVLSCMRAASVEKNPFPCKVAFGIIDTKFHVEFM
ncbi:MULTISPECIES: hypothetical protein [Bacillus cereus group]|uniref:hypothetical protein n=1 Tax=Bacillus cereus group TaxID=86661 RepID=UPI000BFD1E33|nr:MULTISPECIES: hypothetical protein [Bacillus cereus group]MCR6788089.1 hypothetical protein [Bacillus thuringiensis]MCR6822225.1 hypothetical protein [Bacillus thuringiensis]MCR6830165.1 hypothetical protein [Bacillus thuringiensis]MEB8929355.1 hypothetical protein [Bacillus cereus]MEB9327621.1 hypothetical protein [Bacillus cereus]